jgi:uncharacterized membrane protein YtjA (UPF0391 family)
MPLPPPPRRQPTLPAHHLQPDPSLRRLHPRFGETPMLRYAVIFFVIALVAALFGFGGIAASAVGIGKILFFVFALLAVISFVFGLIPKR